MGTYQLKVSKAAPGGRLREALGSREVEIREAHRVVKNCHWTYEAVAPDPKVIEVLVTFPAIREGDIPQLVDATFKAMAIDRQGIEHGLDQKTAVRQFGNLLGIDNIDELVEKLYPEKSYEHDRTKIPPAPTAPVAPPIAAPAKESARIQAAVARVEKALKVRENGHVGHSH